MPYSHRITVVDWGPAGARFRIEDRGDLSVREVALPGDEAAWFPLDTILGWRQHNAGDAFARTGLPPQLQLFACGRDVGLVPLALGDSVLVYTEDP